MEEVFWDWLIKEARKPINGIYVPWAGGYVKLDEWLKVMKAVWELEIDRRYERTKEEALRQKERAH